MNTIFGFEAGGAAVADVGKMDTRTARDRVNAFLVIVMEPPWDRGAADVISHSMRLRPNRPAPSQRQTSRSCVQVPVGGATGVRSPR